jgi:hypothetical protein
MKRLSIGKLNHKVTGPVSNIDNLNSDSENSDILEPEESPTINYLSPGSPFKRLSG